MLKKLLCVYIVEIPKLPSNIKLFIFPDLSLNKIVVFYYNGLVFIFYWFTAIHTLLSR